MAGAPPANAVRVNVRGSMTDKIAALLRQALEALNHMNVQDRVQIIAALRARVHH